MTFKFTDANLIEEVRNGVSLVDFYADWCGPCKMMGPIIEELAKEYEGKVKIGKMNVEDNPESGQRFNIMGIPLLKIFKDGKEVGSISGFTDINTIREELNKYAN